MTSTKGPPLPSLAPFGCLGVFRVEYRAIAPCCESGQPRRPAMLLYRILIVVLALFLAPSMAVARGGGGGGHGGGHSGGGHSGGGHSSSSPHTSSPHSDSHPSGGLHSRGPGSAHSHSDTAPRAIGPKASAP